jgi:hypothetical protein
MVLVFLYTHSLTFMYGKSNTMLHHKINGPCFIFSFENLKEYVHVFLYGDLTLHGRHLCI